MDHACLLTQNGQERIGYMRHGLYSGGTCITRGGYNETNLALTLVTKVGEQLNDTAHAQILETMRGSVKEFGHEKMRTTQGLVIVVVVHKRNNGHGMMDILKALHGVMTNGL